jgi:hypothetical protein
MLEHVHAIATLAAAATFAGVMRTSSSSGGAKGIGIRGAPSR